MCNIFAPIFFLMQHQYVDYLMFNGRMTDKLEIVNNLERHDLELIEVLSQDLPEGSEEDHKKPQSG
jgi:hypothetical protein